MIHCVNYIKLRQLIHKIVFSLETKANNLISQFYIIVVFVQVLKFSFSTPNFHNVVSLSRYFPKKISYVNRFYYISVNYIYNKYLLHLQT